jgi:hypothetical protein
VNQKKTGSQKEETVHFNNWWKIIQFFWYFHFFPPKVPNRDLAIRRMKQASVDKTLARYAYEFLWEGHKEEALQKKYRAKGGYQHRGSFPINPENDEFNYRLIKRAVRRFKRRFWNARRLAKWARFKVRPKVGDYLTSELLLGIEINRAMDY